MRKFLLVVLVGMVLAMDIYGIKEQFFGEKIEEEKNAIEESVIFVYEE